MLGTLYLLLQTKFSNITDRLHHKVLKIFISSVIDEFQEEHLYLKFINCYWILCLDNKQKGIP